MNGSELSKMKPLLVLMLLFVACPSHAWSNSNYDSLAHVKANRQLDEGYVTRAKNSIMALLEQTPSGSSHHIFLMSDLGNIYLEQAEYAVALDLFESALKESRQVNGIESDDRYLDLLFRKSTADARLKNNLAAIIGFDEVRGLYNQRFGADDPRTISIVLDIGNLYLAIGNPGKASSFFDEAEASLQNSPRHANAIRAAVGRAQFYFDTGEFAEALNLLSSTLDVVEKNGEEYISILPFASMCLAKIGDTDSAQVLLEYSLTEMASTMGTHHQSYLETRLHYADVLWVNGEITRSFETYVAVFDEYLRNYNLFFYGIGNQQRAIQYNRLGEVHEKLASLVEHDPTLSRFFLQTTIIFNEVPKHLTISPSEEDREEIEKWIDELESLWHEYKIPLSGINKGRGYLDKKEKELGKKFQSMVKKGILDKTGINEVPELTELQASLDSAQAFVEIVRYRKYDPIEEDFTDSVRYAYLVLHPDSVSYGVNKNGHTLENKYLTYYRSSIKHRFIDDYAYVNYWAPLNAVIGDAYDLILTPDGAYLQINLQTLRNPETQEFLIQEKRIKLITGLQDTPPEKRHNDERRVYIFGNPAYEQVLEDGPPTTDYITFTSPSAISGMEFEREQLSEHHQWSEMLYKDDLKVHEAELLESLYSSSGFETDLYLADSASEAVIKSLNSPFTIHLSLHGYFMENQEFNPTIYQDNQLLRSGILFSGSNHFLKEDTRHISLNDGLLTAYEIYNLDLTNTALVYLSSCETGLGIVPNDNAIKSFVKAFQFAGAESVIMSLWTTEPEYEIEFMNLYYYYWLFEELSKREAFFKAQNQMRISYERPYYWGSFILLGE